MYTQVMNVHNQEFGSAVFASLINRALTGLEAGLTGHSQYVNTSHKVDARLKNDLKAYRNLWVRKSCDFAC